jgi:23S rRNA (uracil1939-C5)-methyltransferase
MDTTTIITPGCPHFGVCGGCTLQHLSPSSYSDYKRGLVVQAMESNGLGHVIVNEPIVIPPHNRRRCNLKARSTQNKITLGYYESKSHQIVDISTCLVVRPEIESLFQPLRSILEILLKGKQIADIFITMSDTGLDILFDVEGLKSLSLEQTEQLIEFGREQNLARISFKLHKQVEPMVMFRTPIITYGGIPVECEADGFMQASSLSDQILTQLILDAVPKNLTRAVDLFCGRGTFTFPLSNLCKVDAFELDSHTLSALERAKNKHQKPVNTFLRNLFEEPLTAVELEKYDFAVMNPPRAGALQQSRNLSQSNIPTIVMVSCDPKTFARDAKILMNGGYRLSHVTPVDQFLWSTHIEVVGQFIHSK